MTYRKSDDGVWHTVHVELSRIADPLCQQLLTYHRDAFVLAFRMLGHAADAEDAVQDAYLRALRHCSAAGEATVDRLWFLKVTANAARAVRAAERARRAREDKVAMTQAYNRSENPEDGQLLKAELARAMAGLNDEWRTAVSLHYELGLPHSEAAQIMGVPEGTSRSYASRGVEALRERLRLAGHTVLPATITGYLAAGLDIPYRVSAAAAAKGILTSGIVPAKASSSALLAIGKVACFALITATVVAGLAYGQRKAAVAPTVQQESGDDKAQPNADAPDPLARKIDVAFWNDYPGEVLAWLGGRYGIVSAYPAMLECNGTFTLTQKDISIREVLQKLAAATGTEIEIRDGRVFLWEKAPEGVFKVCEAELDSTDRWKRAHAVWKLASYGDPRVYPILFKACGDADKSVVYWALAGLMAHLEVLPEVDSPNKDRVVKAAMLAGQGQGSAVFDLSSYFRLIGAMNTPEGTEYLLKLAKSERVLDRAYAAAGLGYSHDPRALTVLTESLAAVADSQPAVVSSRFRQSDWQRRNEQRRLVTNLIVSLGRIDNQAAATALVAWAGKPAAKNFAPQLMNEVEYGVHAVLSRMHEPSAERACVDFVRRKGVEAAEYISAWNPRIADAMVEQLPETFAAVSLALARDPRAKDALLREVKHEAQKHMGRGTYGSNPLEALAAIRDESTVAVVTRMMEDGTYKQIPGCGQLVPRAGPALEKLFGIMQDAKAPNAERSAAAARLLRSADRSTVRKTVSYLESADSSLLSATLSDRNHLAAMTTSSYLQNLDGVGLLEHLADAANGNSKATLASACAIMYSPGAVALVSPLIEDPDATVRDAAAQTLSTFGSGMRGKLLHLPPDPTVCDLIAAALPKVSSSTKQDLAALLAWQKDPRAIDALLESANDPNENIRMRACENLLDFDDPRAVAAVIKFTQDGKNKYREPFIRDLAERNDPQAQAALAQLIQDTSAPAALRLAAALNVPDFGKNPDAQKVVIGEIKDTTLNAQERAGAVRALLSADDPALFNELLNALTQANPAPETWEEVFGYLRVRLEPNRERTLLEWLKNTDRAASFKIHVLAAIVSGPEEHTKEATEFLLGLAGTIGAADNLEQKFAKTDSLHLLFDLLAENKDPRARSILVNNLTHKSELLRHQSLWALFACKAPEAIPVFLEQLKAGDKEGDSASYALHEYLKTDELKEADRQSIQAALKVYDAKRGAPKNEASDPDF